MTMYRLAVAARYTDRPYVHDLLAQAKLDILPVEITADWLTSPFEADGELSLEEAQRQVIINRREIILSHALLYIPHYNIQFRPEWSPGRLIDVGMAMAMALPIIICGRREPSLYFSGYQPLIQCWPDELHDTLADWIERHPR